MKFVEFREVKIGQEFHTSDGSVYHKTDFLRAILDEVGEEEELFAENDIVKVYD